jgi:hypothetical protein
MQYDINNIEDDIAIGIEVEFKYADKVLKGKMRNLQIGQLSVDSDTARPKTTGGYIDMIIDKDTTYSNLPLNCLDIPFKNEKYKG